MTISTNLRALLNQLNQELAQIEQEATEGVNIARVALSRFPDNVPLINLFAYLNDVLLFGEISRRQIQATIETISPTDAPAQVIQEAGESLATLLGRVLEAKIEARRIVARLQELS